MTVRIALLPLDERPVNTGLPAQVAAVAGARVVLPPAELLPAMRRPGDPAGLAGWLRDLAAAAETSAAVVSLDMLAYGGLIASRTSQDPVDEVLGRLSTLRPVRAARPDLPVAGVSVVTRASDSYSPDEEPPYWPRYGRELHRLGATLHGDLLGELGVPDTPPEAGPTPPEPDPARPVPPEVRADFAARRLRNHLVNLAAIDLHRARVVDPLIVAADDTAPRSAGSAEQVWLGHWRRALGLAGTLPMYPGADEVGAVLVARTLSTVHARPVSFAISCGEPDGLARIARYENQPVQAGAEAQVRAAGGTVAHPYPGTGATGPPDAILVLHAPDPVGGDWCAGQPDGQAGPAEATVAAVRAALGTGAAVGLADVRYANGADPRLVDTLGGTGLLPRLSAYAGWNTAGNSIGSVVAALVATVVGHYAGTYRADHARQLLWHRLVDDWAYQAVVRTRLVAEHGVGFGRTDLPSGLAGDYTRQARQLLQAELDPLLQRCDAPRLALGHVSLPWLRTFEIDFDLAER